MFKYIAAILKTFTAPQRILALVLLLFSIVIILVGPAMIKSFKSTNDDLIIRITIQNRQIKELNVRVVELNRELLNNQSDCTKQLLEKDREIYAAVSSIIRDEEQRRPIVRDSKRNDGVLEASARPQPNLVPIQDNHLLSKLKTLQDNYQRRINSN